MCPFWEQHPMDRKSLANCQKVIGFLHCGFTCYQGKEGTGEKQALASTGKFTYCPSRSIVPGAPLFVQEQVGSWFGVLENNLCHIALLQTRRLMVFSTYWEWARWKPMLLRALTHEELLIMTEKVYWLIMSLGSSTRLPNRASIISNSLHSLF